MILPELQSSDHYSHIEQDYKPNSVQSQMYWAVTRTSFVGGIRRTAFYPSHENLQLPKDTSAPEHTNRSSDEHLPAILSNSASPF